MHLLLFLFHNMNDWFLPPDDAMNSFLIDGPIRASLFIELGLWGRMAEPGSINLRDDYFFIFDVLKVMGAVVAHFE